MVELVDRHKSVVEESLIDRVVCKSQRGVRADQHRVGAFEEALDGIDLELSEPGEQRLFCCSTSQSAKNPASVSGALAKDAPMERSGTATITFLIPWLKSLSSARNISARDLPDAGGAFRSKYWLSRAAYAFACISRIPSASVFVLKPVFW